MKQLTNIDEFLKRFNNFIDGEFRLIEILTPTNIRVTIAGQDEARAYDWVSVILEFNNVSDARLLDNSKLSFVDMSDGVSIIKENNKFAFAIGKCYNVSSIKSSTCHIECENLKYIENKF